MLSVTEAAAAHLAQMLSENNAPDNIAIRFTFNEDGIQPQLDGARDGDTTFEHEGRTVLLLDEEAAELLAEKTLDIDADDEETGLTLS